MGISALALETYTDLWFLCRRANSVPNVCTLRLQAFHTCFAMVFLVSVLDRIV